MGNLKRLVVAMAGSFILATVLPSVAATAQENGSCWEVKADEKGFAGLTNKIRDKLGKGKLNLDPQLSRAARLHSREMAKQDLLHHTPGDKLTHRVTNWSTLGENVGVGYSVGSLQDAFLGSPGHRANILDTDYKYIGVGTVQTGDKLWVTVIFEGAANPGTPLKMPKC